MLEFASPRALLSDSSSHFVALIEQTGAAEAAHLRTLVNASSASAAWTRDKTTVIDELELDRDEMQPLLPSG